MHYSELVEQYVDQNLGGFPSDYRAVLSLSLTRVNNNSKWEKL
jgi:hypothetical protein